MELFCVSVFTLSGEQKYHPQMRYLGTDRAEAIRVATSSGGSPWDKPLPVKHATLYSSLPQTVERTVIRYYTSGTSWTSIESAIFTEENNVA